MCDNSQNGRFIVFMTHSSLGFATVSYRETKRPMHHSKLCRVCSPVVHRNVNGLRGLGLEFEKRNGSSAEILDGNGQTDTRRRLVPPKQRIYLCPSVTSIPPVLVGPLAITPILLWIAGESLPGVTTSLLAAEHSPPQARWVANYASCEAQKEVEFHPSSQLQPHQTAASPPP